MSITVLRPLLSQAIFEPAPTFTRIGFHEIKLDSEVVEYYSEYTGILSMSGFIRQRLQVFGNGSLIYNSGFVNGAIGSDFSQLFFTFTPSIYTTLRFIGTTELMKFDGKDGFHGSGEIDRTFDVRTTLISTSASNIITVNPTGSNASTIYFLDNSAIDGTIQYLKNLSSSKAAYVIVNGSFIDFDRDSVYIPPKGGITLGKFANDDWGILSFYNGTLPQRAGSGTLISETASIVSVDLTSTFRQVQLPSPSPSRILVISGFTTGGGTANTIRVYGSLSEATGVEFSPNEQPACGMLLVSNGSVWCIVGVFTGGLTTFDATQMNVDVTGTLVVSSTTNRDSITVLPVDTNENGRLQFFKTLNNVSYGNGAVVGSKDGNFTVNTNYKRFYRNVNTPFSAYAFVSIRRDTWGHTRLFPIAMYPSQY